MSSAARAASRASRQAAQHNVSDERQRDRHRDDEFSQFTLEDIPGLAFQRRALRLLNQLGEDAWVRLDVPGREVRMVGKTPTEGPGATARWLDLYAAAKAACRTIQSADAYAVKQARRVIASLFLYEHQMTPHARRHARLALWDQTCAKRAKGVLPSEAEQAAWAQCRCARCEHARRRQTEQRLRQHAHSLSADAVMPVAQPVAVFA